MLYFTELYKLTDNKRWIELVIRIIRYYYRVGGAKFYPNGVRFYTMYREIQRAGLEAEAKEVYALFDEHVQTILKNDVIYPPHEVNFEQTIVTPAVTILIDKYLFEPSYHDLKGFPGSSVSEESACKARDARNASLIPG